MEKVKTATIKWLMFASLIQSIRCEDQCYANEKSPYLYFSARTSYEVSRGSSFIKTPKNCTPKYIWALIRHGTRFNAPKGISRMRNLIKLRNQIVINHEEGRGELCEKDLESIKTWKFLLDESFGMQLSLQGRSDLSLLAKRLKNQFPSILSSSSRDDFIITASQTQRTKDSAVAFINELLGTKYTNVTGINIPENQQLLYLVKVCPNYRKEVFNDLSARHKESIIFLESNEMKRLLYEVSKKLGFNYNLSYENVGLMYNSCAYENAWHVNSKPAFCAAFKKEHLKVFEYANDLVSYYEEGYGHPMNEKIGCNLIRDMMMTLRDISQAEHPKHKATFYFSHSETLLPTIVKLGLYRDSESLRLDNYNKMKDNREWKLALIDSFASNIITVLFKCPGHEVDENQVVFYQNEHEVIIPGCSESKCSLKLLQQRYEDVFDINKCNSDFCYKTSSSTPKFKVGLVSIYSGVILSISTLFNIVYY